MENLSQQLNPHVAVIGAGMAGLSAACYLTQAGIATTLYEAAPHAGGRCRGVELHQQMLDNGQHLLMGAYQRTWDLMRMCQVTRESAFHAIPLQWCYGDFALHAPTPWPAPWHLLFGLMRATSISWPQRWQLIRLCSRLRPLRQDCSVADWLQQQAQSPWLVEHLWQPLCLAALNTPIQRASANRMIAVIQDALLSSRQASGLYLAKQDLTSSMVTPMLQQIQRQGGCLRLRHRLLALHKQADGFVLQFAQQPQQRASHVVLALPPAQLQPFAAWVPEAAAWAEQLTYQPISTVYLQYPASHRLNYPMQGLTRGLTQWLFDRGQFAQQAGLIAAVISAQGPHQALSQDALAQQVAAEIQQAFPQFSAPIWQRTITEKRATYSCDAGLQAPPWQYPDQALCLAGDYLHQRYPATIESAVQSGYDCAKLIEASLLTG